MKLDAIKHQGKKSTCTYDMSKSSSFVGKKSNDSREKVRKYIRLTFLIPELLKIVDDTVKTSDKYKLTMGILPAVKRYIEAYIINAIKEYKNNKFNIHNYNFD